MDPLQFFFIFRLEIHKINLVRTCFDIDRVGRKLEAKNIFFKPKHLFTSVRSQDGNICKQSLLEKKLHIQSTSYGWMDAYVLQPGHIVYIHLVQ